MKQKKTVRIFSLNTLSFLLPMLLLVGSLTAIAQIPEDPQYLEEDITRKSFDEKSWNNLKKDLNYNEEEPESDRRESSQNFSLPFTINSLFIKSFLFVAAAVFLIFILYKIFNNPTLEHVTVAKTDFTLETIEDDIHNADLESFLRKAIENKNYKQIIRIYYLITIRELATRKVITWKKDKTNHQYLQEMITTEDFKIFKELTNYFEYIWYSKKSFSEEQYLMISERFKEYQEKLKGRTVSDA